MPMDCLCQKSGWGTVGTAWLYSTESGASAGKIQVAGARFNWGLLCSHIWCPGWDDSKAGFSWIVHWSIYMWLLHVAWAFHTMPWVLRQSPQRVSTAYADWEHWTSREGALKDGFYDLSFSLIVSLPPTLLVNVATDPPRFKGKDTQTSWWEEC